MTPVFPPFETPLVPIVGTDQGYPVRRIFCVGRNYAAHAAEMGATVDRAAPFYFTKSPCHLILGGVGLTYSKGTNELHHEVELVVALDAEAQVYGCAVGLDMTRRDLQAVAKDKRRPWDTGKDFEGSAVLGPLTWGDVPIGAEISLTVNGDTRQRAPIDDMVWSVPDLIDHLKTLYDLGVGDIIMTGTPAGVGAVVAGDHLVGQVTGLKPVDLKIM